MKEPTVLLLAGSRSAGRDLLAHRYSVAHKSLIPIAGKTVVSRVLDAIEEALPQSHIIISTESFEPFRREPAIDRLVSSGKLRPAIAQGNLAASVLAAVDSADFPVIVTTADNALLTPDAIHRLVAKAKAGTADAMLVLTPLAAVRAEQTGSKTAYAFRDGSYCNCNLFWIRDRGALGAAEAFRGGGQFIKVRGRFLKAFGVVNVIRYALRLSTMRQMLGHISRSLKVDIDALVLEDGRLAVDVDDERSLRMAEEIIRRGH